MGVDFIGDYDLTRTSERERTRSARPRFRCSSGRNRARVKSLQVCAAGNLWWTREGITEGDLVLAPKPDRTYQYGIVTGGCK